MSEVVPIGSARSPVPRWFRAPELADLPARRTSINGSSRVVLIASENGNHAVVLKLIGGVHQQDRPDHPAEILKSIQRAGEIRDSHHALANLNDVRWLPGHGYVTLSEHIRGRPSATAVPRLPMRSILIAAIQVLDALEHIHRGNSCHGDIFDDNVLITAYGESYLVDFDLADPVLGLRRTHYRTAHLGTGTLAAWQAADVRAFAAMLTGWLELRRAALRTEANADGEREGELRSMRRLIRPLTAYSGATAYDGAERLTTEMSQEIRRVI